LQYLFVGAADATSIFEIWFSEWYHDLGPISCEDAGNGNANLLIDGHDFPFGQIFFESACGPKGGWLGRTQVLQLLGCHIEGLFADGIPE
jgi:hypothetical protein